MKEHEVGWPLWSLDVLEDQGVALTDWPSGLWWSPGLLVEHH
jgi:hypothetical protein